MTVENVMLFDWEGCLFMYVDYVQGSTTFMVDHYYWGA